MDALSVKLDSEAPDDVILFAHWETTLVNSDHDHLVPCPVKTMIAKAS